MISSVDFHIHGLTPEDTKTSIATSREMGLSAIAVIYRTQLPQQLPFSSPEFSPTPELTILTGIEYSPRFHGQLIDVLLLGFNHSDSQIRKYFGSENQTQHNIDIANKQKEFLERQGLITVPQNPEDETKYSHLLAGDISAKAITWCQIISHHPDNRTHIDKSKRQHWQKFVTQHSGDQSEEKFLYWLFFAAGKPGYIPVQLEIDQVAQTVHAAGGVVIYSLEPKNHESVPDSLIEKIANNSSFDGVSAWHGEHFLLTKSQVKMLTQADKTIIGGSDYDPAKKHLPNPWNIATGNNRYMYISKRTGEKFLRWLNQRQLLQSKSVSKEVSTTSY